MVKQVGAGMWTWLPLGWRVQLRVMADHPRGDGPHRRAGDADARPAPGGDLEALGPLRHRRRLQAGRTATTATSCSRSRTRRSSRCTPRRRSAAIATSRRSGTTSSSRNGTSRGSSGGVLRTREFTMKDSYTLDRDQAGLDEGYAQARGGLRPHLHALRPRVLQGRVRHRASWAGASAHEYMAPSSAGEDRVARCSKLRLRRERRDGRVAHRRARRPRRALPWRRSRRRM